jgi:hypothetical protein
MEEQVIGPAQDRDCREIQACLSLLTSWGFREDQITVGAAQHSVTGDEAVLVSLEVDDRKFWHTVRPTAWTARELIDHFPIWIEQLARRDDDEIVALLSADDIPVRERDLAEGLARAGIAIPGAAAT